MKEKPRNISYTDLFLWYDKMHKVLDHSNYHVFLKEECGIELVFGNEDDINVIIKDEKKYLVSKLKYGF
jgi:hypothetical protein